MPEERRLVPPGLPASGRSRVVHVVRYRVEHVVGRPTLLREDISVVALVETQSVGSILRLPDLATGHY